MEKRTQGTESWVLPIQGGWRAYLIMEEKYI